METKIWRVKLGLTLFVICFGSMVVCIQFVEAQGNMAVKLCTTSNGRLGGIGANTELQCRKGETVKLTMESMYSRGWRVKTHSVAVTQDERFFHYFVFEKEQS